MQWRRRHWRNRPMEVACPASRPAERVNKTMPDVRHTGPDWRVACLTIALTSCICRGALGDAACPQSRTSGSASNVEISREAVACWQEKSVRSQARVEEFFELVNAHRINDAMAILGGSLMAVEGDRQAWRQQFSAITSIRIRSILPAAVEDWTATRHTFKLALDVRVSETAAHQSVPYYGWDSYPNVRWVTVELSAEGEWQITAIATGPRCRVLQLLAFMLLVAASSRGTACGRQCPFPPWPCSRKSERGACICLSPSTSCACAANLPAHVLALPDRCPRMTT